MTSSVNTATESLPGRSIKLRPVALLSLLISLATLALALYSYFWATSEIEIQAHTTQEIRDTLSSGNAQDLQVRIQLYDAPVAGELLETIPVAKDDIEIGDTFIKVEVAKKSRELPAAGYLQLCIDPVDTGQPACLETTGTAQTQHNTGSTASGTTVAKGPAAVSCSRTQFSPITHILRSRQTSYADVSCQMPAAPLYLNGSSKAHIGTLAIELDLPEDGSPQDLSEALNQYFISKGLPFEPVIIEADKVETSGAGHSDTQRLELQGSELTLTGANTVDLSELLPATGEAQPELEVELNGTRLVLNYGTGEHAEVDLSKLSNTKDDQKLKVEDGKLWLYDGTGQDSVIDLAQYGLGAKATPPIQPAPTPAPVPAQPAAPQVEYVHVNPFSTLTCQDDEFLTRVGNKWQCRAPETAETITTLTYDNKIASIIYYNESNEAIIIPIETITAQTELSATLETGHVIGTYRDSAGKRTDIVETITTLAPGADNTLTYTDESGAQHSIDVADFQNVTRFINLQTGNNIGTYIDEDGQAHNLAETITEIGSDKDSQEIRYRDETGTQHRISLRELETLTKFTGLQNSGKTIGIYEDEAGNVHNLKETITELKADVVNQALTYTDENANTAQISITQLETLTKFLNTLAGNTIATYVDEHGDSHNINETITRINAVDNQQFSYVNEAGTVMVIKGKDLETLTKFSDLTAAGNLIGTYVDEAGQSHKLNETITELTYGTREFTYKNEAGTELTITGKDLETLTSFSNVITGHGIATYIDEAGNAHHLNETVTKLEKIPGKKFRYTDENAVSVEIAGSDLETITTINNIVTSGHTIATYVAEDGTQHNIAETVTAVVANNDGTFTFTHENGNQSTISIKDLETLSTITNTLTVGKTIGTYTNENGAAIDLKETITTMVSHSDGSYTFTSENGTVTTLQGRDLAALTSVTDLLTSGNPIAKLTASNGTTYNILETVTSLTNNNDGTFTFTHEGGGTSDITLNDLERITSVSKAVTGNRIGSFTDETGTTHHLDETVTSLSLNATDRTMTFTDEAGTATTIDLGALETLTKIDSVLATGNPIGTYTNENDTTTVIKETVTSLAITGTEITFTNEAGAATTIDLATVLAAANYTDSIGASGHQIGTYTHRDGTATAVHESVTTLTDNADGTHTHTSEDGTTTILSDTLATLACTTDQIVKYDGAAWVCSDQIAGVQATIYAELYAGGWNVFDGQFWTRGGLTLTQTGTGQFSAIFPTAHPDGTNYTVSIQAEENNTARDSPLDWIVEGSKTSTGFDFAIVIGDNGDAADVYRNESFSIVINGPIQVLVPGP